MKKQSIFISIALFFFAIHTNAQSQKFEWAEAMGGTGQDTGNSITTDTSGNVYTTGTFLSTVDFDPGPGITNLDAGTGQNVFIQKLNSSGQLVWVKSIESAQSVGSYSIVTDALGNIYLTGFFNGVADFDPGAGTLSVSAAGAGTNDLFVLKLDSNGDLVWAKTIGGSENEFGQALDLDQSGNVYITGGFTGTTDFDPGAGTTEITPSTIKDVFVLKLDSNGDFVWVKTLGMGGNFDDSSRSITVDDTGNVYVLGIFTETVDFDPGVGNHELTSLGSLDIFVLKLDTSGDFIWVRPFGGNSIDIGYGIVLDASENIYVTGCYSGTVDFDPGVGIFNATSEAGQDIFVQKMNSLGEFLWAKTIGGNSAECAFAIAIDATSNVYTIGNFSTTVDFDTGAGSWNLSPEGSQDVFVQKMDPAGNLVWVKSMGGTGQEFGKAITIDDSNNILVTGYFQNTADFDTGFGIDELISNGTNDIFVTKFSPCTPTDPVPDVSELPDVSNECSVVSIVAPTASNNCGDQYVGSADTSFPISTSTVITWTYEDEYGNSSTQTQNVVVTDDAAPVANITTLEDLTGQCSVPAPVTPAATDNCNGTINGVPDVTFPVTAQGTTVVTWTYEDALGNSSTQAQNVIIEDNTAPVADLPSLGDLTGQCAVAAPVTPTATDNCSGAISGVADQTFPITTQGTTVVTWTYEDALGNESTQTQNVIIEDNTPPVVDEATLSDLTGQCSVDAPTSPTATDNCSGAINGIADVTFPITSQGTTLVTWSFEDALGNTSTQTQNVIIEDNTSPVVDEATLSDLTGQCSVDAPTSPTATDNCSGAINGVADVTFPITSQGNTLVTWTFEDALGNTSTQTQNVIIEDNTPPEVDEATLSDLTGQCSVDAPTSPTATDNCSGAINGIADVTFPITSQGTTLVTWSFEDALGNSSTQTQNIIIEDTTAPVADITSLENLTGQCAVAEPAPPTATDNCSGAINGVADVTFPVTSQGTTVVTWTYEDALGNSSTQTQNIIIEDTTAPVVDITSLEDLSALPPISMPEAPTATDNCVGAVTATTSTLFPINDPGTTIVTWIYDDGYGNIATQEQNIIAEEVTGIGDAFFGTISIYPNPSVDILKIELQEIAKVKIQLFSLDGSLARDFGLQYGKEFALEISDLKLGIYFIHIKKSNLLTQTFKMVKTK